MTPGHEFDDKSRMPELALVCSDGTVDIDEDLIRSGASKYFKTMLKPEIVSWLREPKTHKVDFTQNPRVTCWLCAQYKNFFEDKNNVIGYPPQGWRTWTHEHWASLKTFVDYIMDEKLMAVIEDWHEQAERASYGFYS